MPHRPRIVSLGMSLEASVYSPAVTRVDQFVRTDGDAYLARYPFLAPGSPLRERTEWTALPHFRAIPGGPVPADDHRAIVDDLLGALERTLRDDGPVDGVLYDVHGAMSVIGADDPEGELAGRIRTLVGPDAIVSATMDLHGNVTPLLAGSVDLITCYRLAPHEDALETVERAVRNLVDRLTGPRRREPVATAWVPVPILLPGEKTSTRDEPAKGLYGRIPGITARDGVIDAGIWIGYAWADEPRNHAAVVVTGDDAAVVAASAEELAAELWRVRDDFAFVAPVGSLDECLDRAVASDARPFFVSDSGDNPTAGGAGDATGTLRELLARPEIASGAIEAVYASIPDPGAVAACVAAGVGGEVDVRAGALVDDTVAPPARIRGTVEHIAEGDPAADVEAVVRVGGLRVILTARRKPYHLEADFTRNGIDARAADLVVVKIGYLEPELHAMAADWMMALTPGGVDQDLARLPHHRIVRPMVPFDEVTETPDLSARMMTRPI
ncbi:M81 family peptidase [Clavibacter lycopersici]|uniref:M81 family peptidase n=1 Tax=Clavibacter lycopersici TaxID=2301718 RepID=A0A399SYE8_9MICO|nr:M81 family metallopeptidase [Clavibacter lycopersici]RIJ47814.1 M81 family peptidase [Clavibacter lycopersici]RIJ60512.1 M81 family peptidase [Clavibacter lycopersici]